MFWFVCAIMTAATLAFVLAPIIRPPSQRDDQPDLAFYKAQLAEIDRDVTRQILAAEEADRVRAEIGRRLIAAYKSVSGPTVSGTGAQNTIVVIVAAFVCTAAVSTYRTIGAQGMPDVPLQARIDQAAELRANRPSQRAAQATARVLETPDAPDDYLASVAELRRRVPERGDDLQGWELLAYHEARLRNFGAAAQAQQRVIAIKGANASADDLLRHADLLVAAADGYVSPEAEEVVHRLLELAPYSVAARYYLGAMYDQTDRPDLAFRLWQSIVESGAPESLYANLARQQVAGAAFRAGFNYTASAPTSAAALPGPNAEQMAAANDMSVEDRTAMIEGMVGGLAERLATEGGSAAEWARLITAYGVLGRSEEAKTILYEARTVFQASAEAQAVLDDAEKALNSKD